MKIRMRGIKRMDAVKNETVTSVTVFDIDKKLSEVLSDVHKAIDKFYIESPSPKPVVKKSNISDLIESIQLQTSLAHRVAAQHCRLGAHGGMQQGILAQRAFGQYGAAGYDNQSLQSLSGFTGWSSQSIVDMMYGRGV